VATASNLKYCTKPSCSFSTPVYPLAHLVGVGSIILKLDDFSTKFMGAIAGTVSKQWLAQAAAALL
jgi:hypothetical protein